MDKREGHIIRVKGNMHEQWWNRSNEKYMVQGIPCGILIRNHDWISKIMKMWYSNLWFIQIGVINDFLNIGEWLKVLLSVNPVVVYTVDMWPSITLLIFRRRIDSDRAGSSVIHVHDTLPRTHPHHWSYHPQRGTTSGDLHCGWLERWGYLV